MKATINGNAHDIPDNCTITQLLEDFGITPQRVVVEMDGTILRPTEDGETVIPSSSTIEIIRFVGGG